MSTPTLPIPHPNHRDFRTRGPYAPPAVQDPQAVILNWPGVPSVPAPTNQTEYPAAGNIPPSTDPNAVVDPTTGDVVSPTVSTSFLTPIAQWIQANPLLAIGIAAGAVWLLMEYLNQGTITRPRYPKRYY